MRRHCHACLVCASRKGTDRASRPPLQPIPVGGPFHRVGVDILKLPTSFEGNQYAVVFLDYLTKCTHGQCCLQLSDTVPDIPACPSNP